MPSRSLFSISSDMAALNDLLSDAGGDISTPEVVAAVEAWEAELESDLLGKVDAYCRLVREIESRAQVRRDEAARLEGLAASDERAAASLRDRLRIVLELHGIERLDTANHRVSVVGNGGLAPISYTYPPEAFPEELRRTKTSVEHDTKAIRAILEQGGSILHPDSGEPLAVLQARGRRVSIR